MSANQSHKPGKVPRPSIAKRVPRQRNLPVRDTDATEFFSGFALDKKRSGRLPVAVGTLIGVLALCYVILAVALSGSVPKGASLGGVAIGEMDADTAIKELDSKLGMKLQEPFAVKLVRKNTKIDPVSAGLEPDFITTVHDQTDFSLSPIKIFRHLFGAGKIDLQSKIEEKKLRQAVTKAAPDLKNSPVEAGFLCVDSKLNPVVPKPGMQLDLDEAVDTIAAKWWSSVAESKALEMPGKPINPKSTVAQLDEATQDSAKTLLSAPVKVNVGEQSVKVPTSELCEAAKWELREDKIIPKLDGEKVRDFLLKNTKNLEKEPVNATFIFPSNSPVVKPAVNGTKLDAEVVSTRVTAGAVSTENREVTVDLSPVAPAFSTADARKAGIKELIGEAATPLTADRVRTANLAKAGGILTGMLFKPGEIFSLEKALGPIDKEHGWNEAGVTVNGFHTKGMGGGLSQVCVTTLNAAWNAGMDLIEFTPHSEWYSRYPAGIDCTLWVGELDLKWKNPNPNPVVLQGWVAGGQLHIRIWGTKYYQVQTETSARNNITTPTKVVSQSPKCVPSSGGGNGFTISNTRTRLLNGKKFDSKTYTHRYVPQNIIECAKDKPPDAAPPA